MKSSILFLLFLVLSFYVKGSNAYTIDIQSVEKQVVKKNISYFKDVTGRLEFDEVQGLQNFQIIENGIPNFGIQNVPFWFKLTFQNSTNENLFLELAHPVLNEVYFFDPLARGNTPIIDGQNTPYSMKKYDCTNLLFDLNLPPGEQKTYYLKVKSKTQIQLPLFIGSKESIKEANEIRKLFAALFFGVMMAMILYNLAIYFIVRDISYLYYVLFVAVILIVQLVPKGFAYQFLWPESPDIANAAMFFSPAISGSASILFFLSFLNVKSYAPKLRKFLIALVGIYTIGLIFYALKNYSLSYTILDLTSLSASLIMLVGAAIIYRKGNKSALFFLIAWSIFLAGVIIYVMKEVGVLQHNFFTNYTMMIGSGLETVLLSIGLASRINVLKKEKEQAQRKEFIALQRNEKLIREQNIILDRKVKERTANLNQALESIKKAQDKLIESEKMASIGQLTAGIAHEINNPINYVTSNISSLERDLNEINSVIEAYSTINNENFAEKLIEIDQLKAELDYDYLQEEIPTLLEGIKEGADRTANIVASLRVFSNEDKQTKTAANISLGINSSITLLSSKLENIEVKTDYKIEKRVYCFPGKLNQIVMNILSNAIDAINEKKKTHDFDGLIEVLLAEKKNEIIQIEIKDNGIGMDEETKKKVFDPFFTSKEVGSGTGLGMALTYQFIKLHNGDITIDSEPNKGTTITVSFKNEKGDE